MSTTTVVGIDPGLVHTGVVIATFTTTNRQIDVDYHVIAGHDHAVQVKALLKALRIQSAADFVEGYKDRGTNTKQDQLMRQVMSEFRNELPGATVINNMGVKQVVRRPLLRVLGMDKFPTTHHQDLESAGRILVFGMLKDPDLNNLLTQVLTDHIDGIGWKVLRRP